MSARRGGGCAVTSRKRSLSARSSFPESAEPQSYPGAAALEPTAASSTPEREARRLRLRGELVGHVIRLTDELRDPRNLDSPLALAPGCNWTSWKAAHRRWLHGELSHHRYARVLEDGVILRTYSLDFLVQLERIVETLQPLMRANRIVVPVWYEGLGRTWDGRIYSAMDFGGVKIEQTIALSRQLKPEWRQGEEYRGFLGLLYSATHELGHARPADQHHVDAAEFLGHGVGFQVRHGLLLHQFLSGETLLPRNEKRALRRWARDDDWGRPICPAPGLNWGRGYEPWSADGWRPEPTLNVPADCGDGSRFSASRH